LQVTKLQQEVTRIKTESNRKVKHKAENRNALEQVENLQNALNAAHGGQEELRMKAHAVERQKEAAVQRETKLKAELGTAREKIENLKNALQKEEYKVCAQFHP
jgi:chromosome segregation ATPase